MVTTNGTLFASGLIAGDALVGVLLALVLYCGQTFPLQTAVDFGPPGTAIAFAVLAVLLARVDWRRQR
jgi:hypothetical protein